MTIETMAPDALFVIHKAGRGYYRPNAQGYTMNIAEAGRYTEAQAREYTHPNGHEGPRDGMTYAPAPSPTAKAPTMDAVEAVARAFATAQGVPFDDFVWCRAHFEAALSAARPFIAAECAKVVNECPIYPVGNRWSSTTAAREDIATAIKETIR